MNIPLSPFAPENLVSQDGFGNPVLRQPAHHEPGAYLRDSSRVPRRRPFIYINRHTPSGPSRVYRVTQSRTDGVHCRESAGTGPVNLKVIPNECCLSRSPWTNYYVNAIGTQVRDPINWGLAGWRMAVSINKWTPPRKSGGIP